MELQTVAQIPGDVARASEVARVLIPVGLALLVKPNLQGFITGNDGQFATSSANAGSVAALFASPFAGSLELAVESGIVRSLSWA
jgi:hypothetical protein